MKLMNWTILGLVAITGWSAQAEPVRTVLTKENRLPPLYQAELGTEFIYMETEFSEVVSVVPMLRYTVLPDLALYAKLPYHSIKPDVGSRESGIGDVVAGFEFVAYQDVFGYPWILPHAEVHFDTGDEDKGLGTGDTEYLIGVAAGTTVSRDYHFVVDARYRIVSDMDNIPSVAGAFIWDLDDRFSLLSEIEVSREKGPMDDSHPVMFLGGMHYKATPALQFRVSGGTAANSDIDVVVRGNVTYSF